MTYANVSRFNITTGRTEVTLVANTSVECDPTSPHPTPSPSLAPTAYADTLKCVWCDGKGGTLLGYYRNCTAPSSNCTYTGNYTVMIHEGCMFQFSTNVSHTPQVAALSPEKGSYANGDVLTITGESFAKRGNVVTLGYTTCPVLEENSTQITCAVPKHVGGTYVASVNVPDLGLAVGKKLWFRYESTIISVTPKQGSRYAGQRITITGYGFAPKSERAVTYGDDDAELEAEWYAATFAGWTNEGTAGGGHAFGLDIVSATYDTIIAVTNLLYERSAGDVTDWIHGLSVDVAREEVGGVTPGDYDWVVASDGANDVEDVFDGNIFNNYDTHGTSDGGEWTSGHYVMYAASTGE